MKTTPWDKDMPEVNIEGVDFIKEKYLEKIGESSIENLSISKAERLFVFVIEDFKSGVLSSDELASIGFNLFHKIGKKYPESNLFKASLSASELIFAIRSKTAYKNIPSYLADIDRFYKTNK